MSTTNRNFRMNPNYYTYLLIEGEGLIKIIKQLRRRKRGTFRMNPHFLKRFMELIFYVGKGTGKRKIINLTELKLLLQKNIWNFNAKLLKIYKEGFQINGYAKTII